MTKNNVIHCVLAIVLIVYLVVMIPISRSKAADMKFSKIEYNIIDSIRTGFVSADDIKRECINHFGSLETMSASQLNLADLELMLTSMPEIERANVAVLCNRSLRLDIEPMLPVARVFEHNQSYYINRSGKKIKANVNYHIDVPVVSGYFDTEHNPTRLLPLLDYIKNNPKLDALISTVATDSNNDIFLIPVIKGHVVNFGDTTDIADKFARLQAFYTKVMPVKGWDFYDSLSVKWRGQVVATRRHKSQPVENIPDDDEYMIEALDENLTEPLEYPRET